MMHVSYAECTSTLQIRNVPEGMSRELKARAAHAGMSLSDYLRVELARGLERPTIETMRERVADFGRADLPPAADVLAEARTAR